MMPYLLLPDLPPGGVNQSGILSRAATLSQFESGISAGKVCENHISRDRQGGGKPALRLLASPITVPS
jgi:hypothetical protein